MSTVLINPEPFFTKIVRTGAQWISKLLSVMEHCDDYWTGCSKLGTVQGTVKIGSENNSSKNTEFWKKADIQAKF